MATNAISLLADVDWGHMDGGWWIVMMVGMVIFWSLVIGLGSEVRADDRGLSFRGI